MHREIAIICIYYFLQIYFCSDEVLNGEVTVPGMNAFENVKLVNPSFGQLNHPNYYEPGPHGMMSPSRNVPPPKPLPTRIERDLRLIHIQRFDQVSKVRKTERRLYVICKYAMLNANFPSEPKRLHPLVQELSRQIQSFGLPQLD